MGKMFARINRLVKKQGVLNSSFGKVSIGKGEKRLLRNQRLRIESLEDRLLLAVTATDYENIRANYEEFALPSSKSDVNVIEIESNSLSIENLKEAITQAAATAEDDLIVLRTTVGNNILLFSSVDDAMTISIDSSAYGSLTIVAYGTNPLTIDAAGYSTLLTVDEGQVNFGNLTLRGGSSTGADQGVVYCGGGIRNVAGVLQLKEVTVTGNSATGSGDATTHAQGGGIWNGEAGEIYLYESAVTRNTVSARGAVLGGGVYNAGVFSISRSEVFGNTSIDSGGGIYNDETGVLTITDSTIVGNTAVNNSAAMSVYGGGIYNAGTANVGTTSVLENSIQSGRAFGAGVYNSGNLTFSDSEFFNNTLYTGSALIQRAGGGALYNAGVTNLYNCTVAGNLSKNSYTSTVSLTEQQQFLGSGIYNDKTLNVYNSIVALNAKNVNLSNSASGTSRGYYVLSPNTVWSTVDSEYEYIDSAPLFKINPTFNANGILINPGEADLMLTAYSQVIDRGNLGYVKGSTDLAGADRITGTRVDLGAYEYDPSFVLMLETPENFSVTAQSPSDLILTWKSVTNADYYVLRYSDDLIHWTEVEVRNISYEMTVTAPDSNWYFTIQACSDKAKYTPSKKSGIISIQPSTLEVPENLEAEAESASVITLAWTAVENADRYTLRYWTISKTNYTDITVSDTTYTLTKANGTLTYHFSVCAVDSQGHFKDSDFSDEVTLISGKLKTPTGVAAEVVAGENSIFLSWDVVENADSYQITWWSSRSAVKHYVQTADTFYTFTNLNRDYKYYFTVKAIGSSPYTDSENSTPEVGAGWSGLTVVTTLNDEFDLTNSTTSLREALYYAGSTIGGVPLPTTVTFDPDLGGGICLLSKSLGTIEIAKTVTIDASNLEDGFVVDGGSAVRVFTLTGSSSEIVIKNLTIQNGLATVETTGGALARGGGIYSTALSLTLEDCLVTDNSARASVLALEYGKATAYGGGIYAEGALILSNTTVSDNTALASTYTTSAAYRADAYGGGIYAPNLQMTHSIVAGNTAQSISNYTYAISKGGGIYGSGSVVNSLVVRNTAQADSLKQTSASQIYAMAFGGGFCQDSDLVITCSTVAKNSAWSTRSRNQAYYSYGGGVCAISADGTIRINNSIVLLNNTSYIGAIEPGSSMPTGDYEGYDICLYTGNGDILFGNNNITTYDNWSESCTGNIPVFYAYETETEEAMITVSYDGDEAIFTGEDAFQTFLDAFFANVYDSTASPESLDTEDYRLVGTAYWALDMGDVSLAVEADGTQIAYDLDGTDRVLGDSVDIGAYEHGSGQHHDKLTVTTTDDVIDPEDNKISLREALAYAEQLGGATVKFLSDLAGGQIILDASLGGLTVSSDITIDATNLLNDDGEPSLVVNGANLGHRIFTVESSATEVAVTGLILAYGSSDDSAGAIYSEAGALVLNAVRFMYNTSIGSGGALYALGGVSLSDCTFENNASDADGGALYAASRLTMTTTTFRANSAGSAGGALYVSDVAAIEDSVFNSNIATGNGGALYGTGTVTITDTAFTKNSATDGGAIGSSGSLSVYTSELRGNTAENNGGAFHLAGTTMLSYTIVSENRATVDGGGFYQDGASLTLINSQTDRNIAARGGGFFLAEGSLSTLRNVTLTANTADSADGLYIESDATANLYNTIAAINGNGEDAVAESGAELNAYAVLSGYTDWTNKSEGHWNEYDAHYQLFSNKLTDGVYTLSLTASQAIDQGVNAHAVDENGNELTEDVLGNTRIVRTKSSSPEAIVDLGVYECQSTDGRNIQQVYGKEDSITVLAGEEIAPAIEHQVIKLFNDSDATTLSLRIHFDSLYLLFDPSDPGLYLHTDMMGQGNFTVYSDTEDYDSDPTTDSYLLITWNNQNKLWGGAEITEIFSELRFKVSSALDTTQDSSTYIRFTAANITANFQFISAPIEICVDRVTFDVDGDGVVNTSTDVNLLLRYMAGKRGNNLTDNLIYDSSTRDAVAIESYLDAYGSIFDIDGDGHFNVTIDGELLSRYLAGFTADELLYGISFTSAAVRTSSFEIETYIKSYLTGVAEAEPTTENAHTITVTGDGEAVAGEMIALNLTHAITPTDNPLTATTLSLRLYYDSDYFTLDTSLLSYYTTGLVGPAVNPYVIGVDSSNEDGDLATDSWIQISWNRESGWAWNSAQIHSLLKAVFKVNDVAADSDSEPIVSTLHITSHDRTAGFKMDDVDIPLMVIPTHFSETDALWLFDIDGSGSVDIATDGNLLMRYLIFGNVMSADGLLVNGVSTRTEEEILEYLNMYRKAFDIDGDGIVKLDTDVTYFMKFFAGYRGDGLQIANPSKKAIRTTGDELGSYIKRFIPSDQRDDPPTAAALPTALGAGAPLLMAALLPDVGVSAAELPPEKFSVNISSSMTAKAVAPQQVAVTSTSVISVVLPKSEKDGPAPEAAARLWEKPLEDDWLLPELSMLDKSVEFFRPTDEITSFDFDTNWFAHF